jgi:hypothetical protein
VGRWFNTKKINQYWLIFLKINWLQIFQFTAGVITDQAKTEIE